MRKPPAQTVQHGQALVTIVVNLLTPQRFLDVGEVQQAKSYRIILVVTQNHLLMSTIPLKEFRIH